MARVCLLNLFASLGDIGTSSDLPGYEFTVLLSIEWHSTRLLVLFINL